MKAISENEYYARQQLLPELGPEGQALLKKSAVLVVGAGGLGCPVLQYLAGMGIGTLGIVDGDNISVSNLHRQLLFTADDVGKRKVEVAKMRLTAINPLIEVVVFDTFLTTQNADSILSRFDVVVDCSDNYPTRFLVNDWCVKLGKPLVFGAIYRFEGQVSVFGYRNGPTYRCVFKDLPAQASVTDCSESGVVGVLPGLVGMYQAIEVLKIVTGIGRVLSGRMLVIDALNSEVYTLELERDPAIDYTRLPETDDSVRNGNPGICSVNQEVGEIDGEELLNTYCLSDVVLLDVREIGELPEFMESGIQQIPLSVLDEEAVGLDRQAEYVVFCRSGQRSRIAANTLVHYFGFKKVVSLKNGMNKEIFEQWKTKKEQ